MVRPLILFFNSLFLKRGICTSPCISRSLCLFPPAFQRWEMLAVPSVTAQWFHPGLGFSEVQPPSLSLSHTFMDEVKGRGGCSHEFLVRLWLINDVSRDGTCSTSKISMVTVFIISWSPIFSSVNVSVSFASPSVCMWDSVKGTGGASASEKVSTL